MQADAAALLVHVQHDAAAFSGDALHRGLELFPAVAAQRAEDVAGHALVVDAHEGGLVARNIAHDERHMLFLVEVGLVADRAELTPLRRHLGFLDALHEALVRDAVRDEVGDGDDLQAVLASELLQVRHARHRAVIPDDLADRRDGFEAGHLAEVDRGLGLTGSHEHPAGLGAQREDVAGPGERPRL